MASEENEFLAVKFLSQVENGGERCAQVPGLFSIHQRNSIWQEAVIGRSVFLLYGAYLDDRDKHGNVNNKYKNINTLIANIKKFVEQCIVIPTLIIHWHIKK